jgi:hypothetical protein
MLRGNKAVLMKNKRRRDARGNFEKGGATRFSARTNFLKSAKPAVDL